ncbi:hypothetical protein [Oceaniglobus roseus]|uniref:hypothetical protein n=1 Tax=Oceaniglobus roseus TaxID=1737570 RepID=UPI000C7EE5E7|nr:hypothetical protein [Kandeliimicrobium roseum]
MAEARVALRAEASAAIGLGHVRRMLDLATALTAAGADVRHAGGPETCAVLTGLGTDPARVVRCGADPGWIEAEGITHIVADLQWPGNAGAAAGIAALCESGRPVTVIDSMPPDQFDTAPGAVSPRLVVTPYLDAATLRAPPRARDWATGPAFAILDASYAAAREVLDPGRPLPRRVLVSCGGSDPSGLSLRVARALAPTGLSTDLIVGPLFADREVRALEALAGTAPGLCLHPPQPGLAGMIARAGLVVGRVGLLRYQAAVLGRTGLYLHEGPAFRAYLEGFAAAGLAEVFFAEDPQGEARFLDRLAGLADPARLSHVLTLNRAALAAVDGAGAARVAARILAQGKER